MHYYLYPNGGNTRYLQWILEFLNQKTQSNHTYTILDDSTKESSLKANASKINEEIASNQAQLCLTSQRQMDLFLTKVRECGITECYDGLEKIVGVLNAYFKETLRGKKCIALTTPVIYGKEDKHIGSIVERLKQSGFTLVYILNFLNVEEESKQSVEEIRLQIQNDLQAQEIAFVYADYEVRKCLDFFPFVLDSTEDLKVFNTKCKVFKMIPSMEIYPNHFFYPTHHYAFDLSFYGVDYINIPCESLYKAVQKRLCFGQLFPPNLTKLIKGGYPSIDKQILKFVPQRVKRDSIIIPSELLNVEYCTQISGLISMLLGFGYRVVFKARPHKLRLESEREFIEKFRENPLFVYAEERNLSDEEMQRAITIIGAITSMLYSYPSIAKRPSILYYPNLFSTDARLQEDVFYNPKLHLRFCADNINSIYEVIERLANDVEYQQEWEDKITDFCKNDLYNCGNASGFIVDWIIKWYENHTLLKE